jgi:hypothetical protein
LGYPLIHSAVHLDLSTHQCSKIARLRRVRRPISILPAHHREQFRQHLANKEPSLPIPRCSSNSSSSTSMYLGRHYENVHAPSNIQYVWGRDFCCSPFSSSRYESLDSFISIESREVNLPHLNNRILRLRGARGTVILNGAPGRRNHKCFHLSLSSTAFEESSLKCLIAQRTFPSLAWHLMCLCASFTAMNSSVATR